MSHLLQLMMGTNAIPVTLHSGPCFQRESETTGPSGSAQPCDIFFAKKKELSGCKAQFDIAIRKPTPRRFPSVYKLLDTCSHHSFVRI
jgi:hypothetical protein